MRFQYKKIMLTVSVVVMGIGVLTFSTKMSRVEDSTTVEHVRAEGENQGQTGEEMPNGQEEDQNPIKKTPESTSKEEGSLEKEEDTSDKKKDNQEETVPVVAKEKGLEKDAYPEVNELITAYLNAKLELDEKSLAQLVDDVTYLDMTDIQRRTKRIEEYTTIECYTLDGPEEGSYMVYVYSEVKVTGIETLVSGLDGFYVRTDENGKMTITMGEVSNEVEEALAADSIREDVANLIADVNQKFQDEVEGDEQLAAYYEELSIVDTLEDSE